MRPGSHNVARLLESAAERAGADHRSVLFEGEWSTSGELLDRARRLSAGLAGLGVEPGDRVMVVMTNTPDVGVVYHACWRAGAVPTPAIFLLPPPELRHILDDSGARVVVTTPDLLGHVREAAGSSDLTVVVAGGGGGIVDLDDLADTAAGEIVPRADDDLAALMYTGGTTGRAKGVRLTHANLWHAGRAGHEATAGVTLDRTIVPLPLSHSFGLVVSVTGAHDPTPRSSILQRWFEPAAFLELVEEHRAEQATVVPTMLTMLLDQPLEEHDLSSLRRIVCGSAPLPPEVLEAFEDRVPSVTVCEGYGLTETAAATTVNRLEERRVGTVGRPLPDVQIRVVDDDGQVLPPGAHGEVQISGPTVTPGYWNAPEENEAAFTDDGWFRTGDVGSLDADGFLTIHDRTKDVIIRGGFNVYPRDVEDALQEHPAVIEAGVVGRPDPVHGEEIVAFVVTGGGAGGDDEALRDWARERLGGKAYPREIHATDELPRTPVMKLDRQALRERLSA